MVTKLDRLGRSLEHLIELSKQLQAKQLDLVVLDQGIDTSTAVGRLFFSIIGAIAEFEHALMSERTIDGRTAARPAVAPAARNPSSVPGRSSWPARCTKSSDDGKRRYTVSQIAAEFSVTRPTIYRHLAKSS